MGATEPMIFERADFTPMKFSGFFPNKQQPLKNLEQNQEAVKKSPENLHQSLS